MRTINSTIEPPQWHVLKVNISHEMEALSNEYQKPIAHQNYKQIRESIDHIKSMKKELKWLNENKGIFN